MSLLLLLVALLTDPAPNRALVADAMHERGAAWPAELNALVSQSCGDCHSGPNDSALDFESLGRDLSDREAARMWVSVLDRATSGEMPPPESDRPDADTLAAGTAALRSHLIAAESARRSREGRVPIRRLTRREYENTLRDRLGVHLALAGELPPENRAARFDTLADSQGLSPVHIHAYLKAADRVVREGICLGPPSHMLQPSPVDYAHSPYIAMWLERPLRLGGQTIKVVGDSLVLFDGRPYTNRSDALGVRFAVAGRYRMRIVARSHQASTPVTLGVNRGAGGNGGMTLIGAYELSDEPRTIELVETFRPGDMFSLAALELDPDARGQFVFGAGPNGVEAYTGEGVQVDSLSLQGPLDESGEATWPPTSTRRMLPGVDARPQATSWKQVFGKPKPYVAELTQSQEEHVRQIVFEVGSMLFGRPLDGATIDRLAASVEFPPNDAAPERPHAVSEQWIESLAGPPLRRLLCDPRFLFLSGPAGPLDGYDLAARLSYFLRGSAADDELLAHAADASLTDPDVLAAQVDRLIDDPGFDRFVADFLDQWLGLDAIDATSPDSILYPEYDDLLRRAMLAETRAFFAATIRENRPIATLVDADFTFANGRLARHYGLAPLEGEQMRRVALPDGSVRGGLLTQASVLKVTANGTVTSPVKRGNFVLAAILGQPPSSPPAGIEAIEPDTRGATTVRDLLAKHQSDELCASCHRLIDPPGFALEAFDPIGGFRTSYRVSAAKAGDQPQLPAGVAVRRRLYRDGPAVDATGTTSSGEPFADVREYKRLLAAESEQIARHFVGSLIAYGTGGEVTLTDRDEVERILERNRAAGYPIRSLLHAVIASPIFMHR